MQELPHAQAIRRMTKTLQGAVKVKAIYLYGSITVGDWREGWSDIDLLCLTKEPIPQETAQSMLMLRNRLAEETGDPVYRKFEGGILPQDALCTGKQALAVYWGTSGQRMTDTFAFDAFSMWQLCHHGILLAGQDVRRELNDPMRAELYAAVRAYYESLCAHAQKTDRSLYSPGFLLDISRCLYTLRTGRVAAKTTAGEWALENRLCPVAGELETALKLRRDPALFTEEKQAWAETLGPAVQRYAAVLKRELEVHKV